ncbi:hypothetical protein Efla_007719 [Eimeria flavescens]
MRFPVLCELIKQRRVRVFRQTYGKASILGGITACGQLLNKETAAVCINEPGLELRLAFWLYVRQITSLESAPTAECAPSTVLQGCAVHMHHTFALGLLCGGRCGKTPHCLPIIHGAGRFLLIEKNFRMEGLTHQSAQITFDTGLARLTCIHLAHNPLRPVYNRGSMQHPACLNIKQDDVVDKASEAALQQHSRIPTRTKTVCMPRKSINRVLEGLSSWTVTY